MIHSQDVNVLHNSYNLFSRVKGLSFNCFLTLFTVSTIKCLWVHHLGVMPVSITQWRVEIRIFRTRLSWISKSSPALLSCNYCTIAFYFVCYMTLTLFICGNVELNLGTPKTKSYYFSLCHLNLICLSAHHFSKLSSIKA